MKNFDDSAYRNKPGYIYLIHAKGTRRFKIGLTTRAVEARLAELNSSQAPYPLELLKVIQTDNVTETEGWLHKRYADSRRHGEWFEFNNQELGNVIREYDRLSDGDRSWFQFPSFQLPSLESLKWLLKADTSTKGMILAGVGALWLMVGFVGCDPSPQPQPQPQQQPRATQAAQTAQIKR